MGATRNRRRRGRGAKLAAAVAALVVGSGGVCRAGASAYGSSSGVVSAAQIGEMGGEEKIVIDTLVRKQWAILES